MEIRQVTLDNCAEVTGIVVVIDVIRAFTTAALAFAKGAEKISLVSTVEEAFFLRNQTPGTLLMGEVNALPVHGFDLSNSPSSLEEIDLAGKHLIQRTTAGTQGIVLSHQADTLLATGFCCASATAQYISTITADSLTFVITGSGPGDWGDEDAACADYIEALLEGKTADSAPFIQRILNSPSGRIFADPLRSEFPDSDLRARKKIIWHFCIPTSPYL